MLSSRDYQEKRDFIRMSMNCPLTYQSVDSYNQKTGTCVNLSAKGILFQSDDQYPLGTMLKVNVMPKLAISPPFSAIIKLLRVQPKQNNDGFLLAGTIEEVH